MPTLDHKALSPRQTEILVLRAQGYTHGEIGAQLFISEPTVKNHCTTIKEKIGIVGGVGFARFAVRNGLLSLKSFLCETPGEDSPGGICNGWDVLDGLSDCLTVLARLNAHAVRDLAPDDDTPGDLDPDEQAELHYGIQTLIARLQATDPYQTTPISPDAPASGLCVVPGDHAVTEPAKHTVSTTEVDTALQAATGGVPAPFPARGDRDLSVPERQAFNRQFRSRLEE